MNRSTVGPGPPGQLEELASAIDEVIDREIAGVVEALALPPPGAASGTLETADMPLLLGRAFVDGATGRLVMNRGDVEKAVYFEAGRPVLAASSHEEDRMVAMLAREGRLTPEQQDAATRAAEDSGRRMGALLVDLGLLQARELLAVVRQHYEEILLSLFSWTDGQWRFEPGVVATADRARLLRHPATLVREGIARAFDDTRVGLRVGSGRNVFAAAGGATAAEVADEVVRGEAERSAVALFDGVRSVEEVGRASGLGARQIEELTAALLSFGALTSVTSARPPTRGEARDRQLERERLLARHALALEADYFQVLGVARGAGGGEVRRAYERIRADVDPATVTSDLERALAAELTTIREVLEEAVRVLTTPWLRAPYEASLGALRPRGSDGANR